MLAASGQEIPRAALEAITLEAYGARKLTTAQLRRLLDLNPATNSMVF